MIYQKLLMGSKPYFVSVGNASAFEIHRHPEIELSFCMEGTYDIICENKRYSLTFGDFAVILPMTGHEIPRDNSMCKSLTIEVGYTLLGDYFEAFTNCNSHCLIYKKSELQHSALYKQLLELLVQTATLHSSNSDFDELLIKGNLYKISALLLQMLPSPQIADIQNKKLTDAKKIDKAIEIIYNHYYEPLDIKAVSFACGYSKSNFCKIFKNITGDTFHRTLNRHRIEIACMLLRESDDSIEKIATEAGFSDAKSFCRTFKQLMGTSAGEYRKSLKAR
jgi:AraC-like DNA-binding protein